MATEADKERTSRKRPKFSEFSGRFADVISLIVTTHLWNWSDGNTNWVCHQTYGKVGRSTCVFACVALCTHVYTPMPIHTHTRVCTPTHTPLSKVTWSQWTVIIIVLSFNLFYQVVLRNCSLCLPRKYFLFPDSLVLHFHLSHLEVPFILGSLGMKHKIPKKWL